ncbi:Sporulation-specific protein 22 [Smittium culicis]|uniref:Sporulation-specific protein 22 n=1 Tax=Smittium culicis TaxID=133412 RepID=A0A1R1Y459_9FUNG|nr:Sporulation-specific protein 22 [Smittium culicis]
MKISFITFMVLPIALSATSIKEILSKGEKTLDKISYSDFDDYGKCKGEIDVKTNKEIDKLASCTKFLGNIRVTMTNIKEISLGSLSTLKGSILVVGNYALKKIDFSGLQSIEGNIYIGANYQLESVDFKNLKSANKVAFKHNFELNDVNLNVLSKCKDLSITGSSIQNLTVDNLKKIKDDIKFSKNSKLISLNFGSLDSIGGDLEFGINKNSRDLKVNLENLKNVSGGVTLRGLSEIKLTSLTSIGSSLLVRNNKLANLDFPELTSVGQGICVSRNSNLVVFNHGKLNSVNQGGILISHNQKLKNKKKYFKSLEIYLSSIEK